MITEDYCSYEVTKLLREKGFDAPCRSYYTDYEDYVDFSYCNDELTDLQMGVWETLRPTHQMAMKWLREEKNILIYVYPVIDLPVKNNYTFYWKWDGKKKRHDAPHIGDKHNYESFEQAVEAALKYSLENLI